MSDELDRIAPVLEPLGALFADAGHELALVGGPVRDAMLGRAHNDLDFATSARPEETERLLGGWGDALWDMGRDFGTIGARKGPWVVEVTTYRSESYDPTSRKPVVDFGDTLAGDLGRRDFTVNAMAVSLPGPRVRRPVRRRGRPRPPRCCARPDGPRTPSPTTRCGCCGPPGSPPSWPSPSTPASSRR